MKLLPLLFIVLGIVFLGTLMDSQRSPSDGRAPGQLQDKVLDDGAQALTSQQVLVNQTTGQLAMAESALRGDQRNDPDMKEAQLVVATFLAKTMPLLAAPTPTADRRVRDYSFWKEYTKVTQHEEVYQIVRAQTEERENKSVLIPLVVLAFCAIGGIFKVLPDNKYGLQ